jgi:GDPmannose 4,6-dehydratase
LKLHYADLTDSSRIVSLIQKIEPVEIYNLAAQSHVRVSFDEPEFTGLVTGLGATRVLEALRVSKVKAKYYQASSSEMFGATPPPQSETTNFYPRSPYGAAKVYAFWMTKNYREAFSLFAVNGILFNHESPRRGETFVTRKISRAVARIKLGMQDTLFLGNLDAKRDWGFAPEYVEAMWLMLQANVPDDFVISTGTSFSVQEFLEAAFDSADLNWRKYVKYDHYYTRPTEVNSLIGNSTKAKSILGWNSKLNPLDLAGLMVEADLKLLQNPNLKVADPNVNYWNI